MIASHMSPGLLSKEDIKIVNDWLKEFNTQLIAYKQAFGEPAGYSVDAKIESLNWYEKNKD